MFNNIRYFEDRRPAANIDPYLVGSVLVDIALLGGTYLEKLKQELFKST